MIYLQFGTNSVITTLNSGTASAFYTWQLINKDGNEETVFYTDDVSNNKDFYNRFIITLTSSIGLTAGRIDIPKSEYHYIIWEMPDQYNLNIASASGIVERGILRYIGEDMYNRPKPTIENFSPSQSSIKTFNVL